MTRSAAMIEKAFVLSIFTGPLLTPVKLARVLPCDGSPNLP
jgi:hypothetical protein